MERPRAPQDLWLATLLLDLPFASTAVLAAFAGKDRSTVNQRLLHWVDQHWVQTVRPGGLGKSRQVVYAFTAHGLQHWVPLAYPQWEASSFAATFHLDPLGLLTYHVPALVRYQTAYAVGAQIVAQLRRTDPLAQVQVQITVDGHQLVTLRKSKGKRIQQIRVASDLFIAATIRTEVYQRYESAQIWVDDGVMPPHRIHDRLHLLAEQWRYAEATTPQTYIIVRDVARLGVWQLEAEAVQRSERWTSDALPGWICLVPVPWTWPLTNGGQPAATRPGSELRINIGDDDPHGVALLPLEPDRWPLKSTVPHLDLVPSQSTARTLTAEAGRWMQHVHGTLDQVYQSLEQQRSQRARWLVQRTHACLTWKAQQWVVLSCVAWMPMVTPADLAQLLGIAPASLKMLLAPLHTAGYVAYQTPPTAATLPVLANETTRTWGVLCTDLGRRLLETVYPTALGTYRRATKTPRWHESGVARFFTLFDQWIQTQSPTADLWWWAGPTNRLRVLHEGKRWTVYPDALGICVEQLHHPGDPLPYLWAQPFYLEFDMGHERRAAWKAKVRKYGLWLQAQQHKTTSACELWTFVLVVVAPTKRQATMIEQVLRAMWGGLPHAVAKRSRGYVTTFAALDTGAFDTIWTTIGAKSPLEPFFWEKLHTGTTPVIATHWRPSWSVSRQNVSQRAAPPERKLP